MMYNIPEDQLAVIRRCIEICEEIAEDVNNGNVFIHDKERLDAYRMHFSTGPMECAEKIRKTYGL
jgi:hypothetical protein